VPRDSEFLLRLLGARGDARFLAQALDGDGATMHTTQQPAGLELGQVLADALGADSETPCQPGAFDAPLGTEQTQHLAVSLVGEKRPLARRH
jgi:hypothetical protein